MVFIKGAVKIAKKKKRALVRTLFPFFLILNSEIFLNKSAKANPTKTTDYSKSKNDIQEEIVASRTVSAR